MLRTVAFHSLQLWVNEMAAFVKSIDTRHLVTVGQEGFYPQGLPQVNSYTTLRPGKYTRLNLLIVLHTPGKMQLSLLLSRAMTPRLLLVPRPWRTLASLNAVALLVSHTQQLFVPAVSACHVYLLAG